MKSVRFGLALAVSLVAILPGYADGTRVHEAPFYANRKITKQFATAANNFTINDPNTDSLTLANATGKNGNSGDIAIALTTGFTPPVTLTVWYWDKNQSKYIHIGPDAATYSKAFDATYTSSQFSAPPNTAFLVQSSAAVTGNVYVSGTYESTNNNSASGFDQ